jgi:hypothetical protein
MNRLFSLTTLGVIVLYASNARAQQAESGANAVVEGGGVKIGEGTVFHPILGIETGVVQNVFYEENQTNVAGMMRIIAELATGSLPAERMQMPAEENPNEQNFGDLAFRVNLHAQYEEYLTNNDTVRAQRGLSGFASAHGIVWPKQTWQFGFSDTFSRTIRPANFESTDNTDRDINALGLELRYRPKGRTIHWLAGYSNTIDYFEDADQQFANRIAHRARFNLGWQWLPVTRLYTDLSIAYVGPLGDASTRPQSFPLKTVVGIASAITVKTSINARIGFGKGFYPGGTADFTNVIGGVGVGYRASPELRFSALYEYDFEDSINANFYRDHAIKAKADYRRNHLTLTGGTELRFRLYRQIIPEVMSAELDRNDVIFAVSAGAIYNFKNWIAATLDYQLAIDSTDFRYMADATTLDDPSYVRQSIMAGVRAAY